CQIVDDSYNNDLGGFQISLDFLDGLGKEKRTVILSDFQQSGLGQVEISDRVINMLQEKGIEKFYGIGLGFQQTKDLFKKQTNLFSHFYLTTDDFINQVDWSSFRDEVILVKGGRVFQFEKIVKRLQKKIHGTVMSVDIERMINNLNFFKSLLDPQVKLMVMVKALAYGSGSNEIASLLQYHKVDYLGVAYTDEGVDLRKNNVRVPIMVMNPVEDGFASLFEFDLEPEVYSLSLLKSLIKFLDGREMGIHLKIDTGMNRLGIVRGEIAAVINLLSTNKNLRVLSIFSHLAGSDDPLHDGFTKRQYELFRRCASKIEEALSIKPLRHILNSSGILRFPDLQLDMVRLGIGLYGIDPSGQLQDKLKPVVTLKTVISQIKIVEPGESIGYGRKGAVNERMRIATIAIGYADGFSRGFSQGKGIVVIRGRKVPVVGNVCMDMTMVDITRVEDAAEGDEVIIFGDAMPIQSVAERINTIPYEILTNTGERVKRIFLSGGT
ncbi:MAG: alanine racemase, partial [Cyclobacteriaceae bacterium]